jgi:hypothetical protein
MRMMILAGAVLALSACGGGETEANNTMAVDNTMMSDPMMDPNMSIDANSMNMTGGDMTGTMNGMDANTTANMMAVDANTNAPDTNLANGM